MKITLIRHAQSQSNVGLVNRVQTPDHTIALTEEGTDQAYLLGKKFTEEQLKKSIIYCSPYHRTRQTLFYLCKGAGTDRSKLTVYEDPLLREMEFGYTEKENQLIKREHYGWFYFRYTDGESPADVYNRVTMFIDSMMRQSKRKENDDFIIISHGMTIRVLVMRFLHLTVEQFTSLDNPDNTAIITLETPAPLESLFTTGRWGVTGLKLRPKVEEVKSGLG